MSPTELFLFYTTVYGGAWVISKSLLFQRPRMALINAPFLGKLVQCIVCTSAWVAMGLWVAMEHSDLLGRHALNLVDAGVLVLSSTFFVWVAGSRLGDAD